MKVHVATPVDLEAACTLVRAQFAEHGIGITDEHLRAAVAGLLEGPPRGRVLIARGENEALGIACLAYTWTLENGGFSAWLDELYVEPQAREKGTGTALLRAALALAGADGCSAIDLEVDEGHARAARLYRREGFAPLPRKRWQRRLTTR
jgi:GNAT superfamily N-acetyltransferase